MNYRRVVPISLAVIFASYLLALLFWPGSGWISEPYHRWSRCEEAKSLYRDALRGGDADHRLRRDYLSWCDRD